MDRIFEKGLRLLPRRAALAQLMNPPNASIHFIQRLTCRREKLVCAFHARSDRDHLLAQRQSASLIGFDRRIMLGGGKALMCYLECRFDGRDVMVVLRRLFA